jgi:hypothetical protein
VLRETNDPKRAASVVNGLAVGSARPAAARCDGRMARSRPRAEVDQPVQQGRHPRSADHCLEVKVLQPLDPQDGTPGRHPVPLTCSLRRCQWLRLRAQRTPAKRVRSLTQGRHGDSPDSNAWTRSPAYQRGERLSDIPSRPAIFVFDSPSPARSITSRSRAVSILEPPPTDHEIRRERVAFFWPEFRRYRFCCRMLY